MSKIKNRQKFSFSNYKLFFYNIFTLFVIICLLICFLIFKENFREFFFKNIEFQSQKYGYILKELSVLGIKHISEEEIISILDNNFEKSIFLISLKDIKEELIQHRWIKNLTLRTKYPSKIIISIIEKKPIAIYCDDNNICFFIDNHGKIIDEVGKPFNGYFLIVKGEEAIINVPKLVNNLNNNFNFQITKAEYIGKRRWDILINNKLNIKLPENDYISAVNNLSKLLIKIEKFDYSLIEFIDLRIPKKAIIRFYDNNKIDLLNEL
tara:strand:- start:870 stop:1667 length:798 start_codon:yes stop_codon:yes gene_type:complete